MLQNLLYLNYVIRKNYLDATTENIATVKRILQNPCINKLIWYICFFFARIDNIILTCRSLLKYSKVIINSFFIDNNSNIYTHTPLLVVIILGRKSALKWVGNGHLREGGHWAMGILGQKINNNV